MEVKPGYKQTEVGIIPEDWDTIPTAELVEPTAPICYGVVQVGQDTNGGVPIVAIKYVKEISHAPLHRTSMTVERPYARSRVKGRDVLISIKGTIGRVGIAPDGFEGNISRELARLRLKEEYSAEYVTHQFEAGCTQARIAKSVVGTTRLEFSIAALRNVELPVPKSRDEQCAIATALSDVGALLGGLDRLIAKKRDLKQAAMQQLLTGQTRLPGFIDDWEVRRLGNIAPLQRGFDLPNSALRNGPYPVVYSNGILNHHAAFQSQGPGVVTGRSGTIGKVTFVDGPYWPHNTSLWVTGFKDSDPHFVFYLYTHIRFERFATGSGVPTLNRNDVHAFEVAVPNKIAEQTAIATILSDMDAELSALEARRDKTRALKQAMMQELLTGRTRLV